MHCHTHVFVKLSFLCHKIFNHHQNNYYNNIRNQQHYHTPELNELFNCDNTNDINNNTKHPSTHYEHRVDLFRFSRSKKGILVHPKWHQNATQSL